MRILITGSSGLIGGEAVDYFAPGNTVFGIDNNMRRVFFGEAGDTNWNKERLLNKHSFYSFNADIRSFEELSIIFRERAPFDAIIHCAGQPSHDKAREIPLIDHAVNATGTLNLLELTRRYSPEAVFVFMSTNKVYGDAPNEREFGEFDTRYDVIDWPGHVWQGFDEGVEIDQSTHSIFGANKLAADIMVQEYARSYGMKTIVFRAGCLTGRGHSGVELHGFLSYLIKTAKAGNIYKIYGYKGKQVRDNLHSLDVVKAIEEVIQNPNPGVYNLGGGRQNSISILEALERVEVKTEYVYQPRLGDHVCYITDMSKFKRDYPNWKVTKSLDDIFNDLYEA